MIGPSAGTTTRTITTTSVNIQGRTTIDEHREYDDRKGQAPSQLAPGDTMTCTGYGKAVEGQYMNVGTVTATAPIGPPVSASDVDYYFGVKPPKGYKSKDGG